MYESNRPVIYVQDIPGNFHIHADYFNKLLKKYYNLLMLKLFLVTVLNYNTYYSLL